MALISLKLEQPEQRSSSAKGQINSVANWEWFAGGHGTDAGEIVNDETALSIATVFACIRVLSESVASVPCNLYRRTPQGRLLATDQRLHYLLSVESNSEMTSYTFFECMVKAMALCGNAYAEIERDSKGEPIALWPLHPRATKPVRLDNGALAYRTTDGESGGQYRIILSQNMLHCPLFPSFDGLVGLSPLGLTRQILGQALAAERLSNRFLKNFSVPAVVITTPEEVDAKTKSRMREEWDRLQSGGNSSRAAIADGGMKIEKLSLTPDECQFIQTRKFNVLQIAAMYRVPAGMVGDDSHLSKASAEQTNLSFVVDSLRPYLNRLSGEIVRKLLRPAPGQQAEFEVDGDLSDRLRGDTAASSLFYQTAIQNGFMSPAEVRRELNLNEGPDSLNVYRVPVNYMNSERLLDPAKQVTTPPVDVMQG